MINSKFRPLGQYKYQDNNYTSQEALNLLKYAKKEVKPVICRVTYYDEEIGCLILDFYGIKGIVKKGYISKNRRLQPQMLVGMTTKVNVDRINQDEMNFIGTRISIEQDVTETLKKLQIGDHLQGVVHRVIDNKCCAFIDIAEGKCAYLGLQDTTYLPNTCCKMSEFVYQGMKVNCSVIRVPPGGVDTEKNTIRVSLLEDTPTWDEEVEKYSTGVVVEGMLRQDNMLQGVYYLLINEIIYIKVYSDNVVELDKPVCIQISKIDKDKKEIIGIIEKESEDLDEKSNEYKNEKDHVNKNNMKDKENLSDIRQTEREGSMFQSRIKSTNSPFIVYKAEEKVFDSEPLKNVSMEQIFKAVRNGHLGEEHFSILKTINQLVFCTNKLIMSYLYSHPEYQVVTSQAKLTKKLETMVKLALIDRFFFKTDNERGLFRVYNLNENGYRFLRMYLNYKNTFYNDSMIATETYFVKRQLAANQFALSCMERIHAKCEFHNQQLLYITNRILLRPTCILEYDRCLLLVEAVRKFDGWQLFLKEKLDRFYKLFENRDNYRICSKNIINLKKEPYIVFVCEDEEHTKQVEKLIVEKKLQSRTFFSYDLLIFEMSPEFSMFRFGEIDKKFFYSIVDLVVDNKECYTESKNIGPVMHKFVFNSFPEQYLRQLISSKDDIKIQIRDIVINDEHQKVEYLYRNDFNGFFESARLSRDREVSEAIWEPRIFFLGSGNVGKTSLIKVVGGYAFDAEEPKTYGINVMPNHWKNLYWMHNEEKRINHISVWDFAGQKCDNVFGSVLMTGAILCVIVIDSRREDKPDEWLKYVQAYAPRSKVMLVINKIDSENISYKPENRVHYNQLNIAWYLEQYENIVGVYHISCKNPNMAGNDLELFKHDIFKNIISLESKFRDVWPIGSQKLRDWIRNNVYGSISMRDFNSKCKELGLDKQTYDPSYILDLCIRTGLCIYRKEMGSCIVLKPQWFTCAMDKLLSIKEFSFNKWQLTRDEIIKTIEMKNSDYSFEYESGDGEALLELMEKLQICKREDDVYIFPCFLPYYTKRDKTDVLLDLNKWYEWQVSYLSLPTNIFTELQVELWGLQWNKKLETPISGYEPDKEKIVFCLNGQKMLAWKKENNITLAVETEDSNTMKLTDDKKQAIKEARAILRKINIRNGLETDDGQLPREDSQIQDKIVLKGRKNDIIMSKTAYPYPVNLLKRICMSGINRQYFPQVDRWFYAADLLLETYNNEKILDIYRQHILQINIIDNNDMGEDLEINQQLIGTGFLMPYWGKWYCICCAHEIEENCALKAITLSGEELAIELVYQEYNPNEEFDMAICSVQEVNNTWKSPLPKDMISFRSNYKKSNNLYCLGFNNEKVYKVKQFSLLENSDMHLMVQGNEDSGKFLDGFSGAPIIDLDERCVIGMLRQVYSDENKANLIPIEAVWRFIERYVDTEE